MIYEGSVLQILCWALKFGHFPEQYYPKAYTLSMSRHTFNFVLWEAGEFNEEKFLDLGIRSGLFFWEMGKTQKLYSTSAFLWKKWGDRWTPSTLLKDSWHFNLEKYNSNLGPKVKKNGESHNEKTNFWDYVFCNLKLY